jgi:hypothetical protein
LHTDPDEPLEITSMNLSEKERKEKRKERKKQQGKIETAVLSSNWRKHENLRISVDGEEINAH